MLLFADDPTVTLDPLTKWVGMITVLSIAVTSVCTVILQVFKRLDDARREREEKAREVVLAQKASQVATTLATHNEATAEKLDSLAKTTDATHTLVNSNMGAQLNLTAVALRRIADLTKDPADIQAAEGAEGLYAAHVTKQAVVDASKVKDFRPGKPGP